MISTEEQNFFAFRQLEDAARTRKGPLVLWIGAGASRWGEYPSWAELAENCHGAFARLEPRYARVEAADALGLANYPEVFSRCKVANIARYHAILSERLKPRPETALYRRLVAAIQRLEPISIVTTNVDELLEKNFQNAMTLSRANVERIPEMLRTGQSFVAKLHGSIGDVSSLVFTEDDYKVIVASAAFQNSLTSMFESSTVAFVGYGLRDDYVLKRIEAATENKPLFGAGPHFAVVPDGEWHLPACVQCIRYSVNPHTDHRPALGVVEEIANLYQTVGAKVLPKTAPLKSAHFLAEFMPPGTVSTSQTMDAERADGKTIKIVIGDGYIPSELPSLVSPARHDLLVGLIAFDKLFASVGSVRGFHELLGSERFWQLVDSDVIQFVHWVYEFGVVFPDFDLGSTGELTELKALNPDSSPVTAKQILRKQVVAAPEKELAADEKLTALEGKVIEIDQVHEGPVLQTTRSLLLRPSVRKAIAMSDGTPAGKMPRWHMYPALRLSTLVKVAAACAHLEITSSRINYGAAALAGPAFSIAAGAESVEDIAGYVVAGTFKTNLGLLAELNPSLQDAILRFRETPAGVDLRQDVLRCLADNRGYDAMMAINGGIQKALSSEVMQRAQDQMTKLFVHRDSRRVPRAALWNDPAASEHVLDRWRARSRQSFIDEIARGKLDKYSDCPCGSGEKVRFCCAVPLGVW